MDSTKITTFVESLALPVAQADSVARSLIADINAMNNCLQGKHLTPEFLAQAASYTLRLVLGEGKVDTRPVHSGIVDANWSVPAHFQR
jgi:hypothetical protein